MSQQSADETRNDSVQAASEGAVQQIAGDIIDKSTRDICKYVNTVAGDTIVACPDNEVRRIVLGVILAYEERKADAS